MRRVLLAASLALLVVIAIAGAWLFGVFQPNIPTADADGPTFHLEQVADGFSQPVQVVESPDGLAVVEQGGRIKALDGTVLLDLSGEVSSGYEQGLLSAVYHEGQWFTHHTGPNGDTVVSRWTDGVQDVLWTHEQPYGNHNGGMLTFGPDGMLYLGFGDGGAAGDPHGNGQNTDTHLGGILRFQVTADGVAVPEDNPFRDGDAPYLYHYGLRNPWRFSFDMDTGDLWIGDVGQGNVEEIDVAHAGTAGLNFGWDVFEGSNRYKPGTAPDHVPPVAEYDHDGGHRSVTGGYVVRDGSTLDGTYIFGDFASGQLWTYDGELHLAQDTDLRISSFGQDADGTVYVVDYSGSIHQLVAG